MNLSQRLKIESYTQYLLDLGSELGLGAGVREYPFAKCIKRKFMADVAWPGRGILMELEGGAFIRGRHTRGKGYEADCEKYSLASILGFTLIRCTYGMVDSGKARELLVLAVSNHKNGKGK